MHVRNNPFWGWSWKQYTIFHTHTHTKKKNHPTKWRDIRMQHDVVGMLHCNHKLSLQIWYGISFSSSLWTTPYRKTRSRNKRNSNAISGVVSLCHNCIAFMHFDADDECLVAWMCVYALPIFLVRHGKCIRNQTANTSFTCILRVGIFHVNIYRWFGSYTESFH